MFTLSFWYSAECQECIYSWSLQAPFLTTVRSILVDPGRSGFHLPPPLAHVSSTPGSQCRWFLSWDQLVQLSQDKNSWPKPFLMSAFCLRFPFCYSRSCRRTSQCLDTKRKVLGFPVVCQPQSHTQSHTHSCSMLWFGRMKTKLRRIRARMV